MMRTFRLTSPSIRGAGHECLQDISHQQVHQLLDEVLGPGLHAKRIASLADATLGVMHTASLAVCTIGHGWRWLAA
jgi:hypothetical protein